MGTSISQSSPATVEWDRVRDLYRKGIRDAGEISRHIAQALSPDTRDQMAGPGVRLCMSSLMDGARQAVDAPHAELFSGVTSALGVASRIRVDAERRLALTGCASRFADIALDALGGCLLGTMGEADASVDVTPLSALAASYQDRHLHALARDFLCEDMDRCFQYFVARDIAQFVGAEAFPTIFEARALCCDVGSHCRAVTAQLPFESYESQLRDALADSRSEQRQAMMAGIVTPAVSATIDAIIDPAQGAMRPRARGTRTSSEAEEDANQEGDGAPHLRLLADDEREADLHYLPVYSLQAAAGYFGLGEDVEQLGFIQAPHGLKVTEQMFVTQIVGKSMEPGIPDGSYAVFRAPVVGSRNGKIVLAQRRGYEDPDTGGSYTVKKYESVKQVSDDGWRHTAIRLVPENPSYDPIEIEPEEADELAVIAELVRLVE